MASNTENVRLDIDNASYAAAATRLPPPTSTLRAPPPYPHSLTLHPAPPPQYQLPLPGYPTAPPPEYGQVVANKAYEASNATGPYQHATSQANQLHQVYLPPLHQMNDDQSQQLVLVDSSTLRRGQSQPSFLGHFILSCCVFWCCGWMCGGIAFLVALIAQNSSASGDVIGARRLGHVSLALSICGILIGTIMTIVFIVYEQY